MEFQPRTYRQTFNPERFASFTVQYLETDLWIGTDQESFHKEIAELAQKEVIKVRKQMEEYIHLHPAFKTSLKPVDPVPDAPESIKSMIASGFRTHTGPMASVAGMFAHQVGERIRHHFKVKELVIENGGDCYIFLKEDLLMTVYAGHSPLSEKIAVIVPASETPCGICTSSGTVGPSLSFGKADAVMVACYSPALADGWATALANRVKSPANIEAVLKYSEQFPEILSLVIICEDKTGIRGNFEVRFVHNSA
jgi:ApbE superfamily uncharacterized protein (UPF0280 family)